MSAATCSMCGCESLTDPCARCESETHWAGSDRAVREVSPRARAKRAAWTRATIHDALTNLPDEYALLALFMLPGSAPADPDHRGGTASPARPPARLEVIDLLDEREKRDSERQRLDASLDRVPHLWRDGKGRLTGSPASRRQGLLPTLDSWVRLVDEELWDSGVEHAMPWLGPCSGFVLVGGELDGTTSCTGEDRDHAVAASVAGDCAWLLPHLDWILAQRWADEMAADLGTMLKDIRKATGWRPEGRVLPCPKCGWDMHGEGDYDEERHRFPWYSCGGCPNTITTQSELDRADNQARDSVTLRYAAESLAKSVSALKEWQRRGWISPLGRDSRGTVYSMKALRRVADSVTNGKRFERVSS